jgi:hypothetical protein
LDKYEKERWRWRGTRIANRLHGAAGPDVAGMGGGGKRWRMTLRFSALRWGWFWVFGRRLFHQRGLNYKSFFCFFFVHKKEDSSFSLFRQVAG